LVEKNIKWSEAYTDKTQFLKEQFEDVVGPGSYFRFEGVNRDNDDEYYCIIGPANIHKPRAKFFAGVRKLPATYSAGGKYFDSMDGAAEYARTTWGIPIPDDLKPYTSAQLYGIESKINKWKKRREREEEDGGNNTVDKESSSSGNLGNDVMKRFNLSERIWLYTLAAGHRRVVVRDVTRERGGGRAPLKYWDFDLINQYMEKGDDRNPEDFGQWAPVLQQWDDALEADSSLIQLYNAARSQRNGNMNAYRKWYKLRPNEVPEAERILIGYDPIDTGEILTVGPYKSEGERHGIEHRVEQAHGRFNYFPRSYDRASPEQAASAAAKVLKEYSERFQVPFEEDDVQLVVVQPSGESDSERKYQKRNKITYQLDEAGKAKLEEERPFMGAGTEFQPSQKGIVKMIKAITGADQNGTELAPSEGPWRDMFNRELDNVAKDQNRRRKEQIKRLQALGPAGEEEIKRRPELQRETTTSEVASTLLRRPELISNLFKRLRSGYKKLKKEQPEMVEMLGIIEPPDLKQIRFLTSKQNPAMVKPPDHAINDSKLQYEIIQHLNSGAEQRAVANGVTIAEQLQREMYGAKKSTVENVIMPGIESRAAQFGRSVEEQFQEEVKAKKRRQTQKFMIPLEIIEKRLARIDKAAKKDGGKTYAQLQDELIAKINDLTTNPGLPSLADAVREAIYAKSGGTVIDPGTGARVGEPTPNFGGLGPKNPEDAANMKEMNSDFLDRTQQRTDQEATQEEEMETATEEDIEEAIGRKPVEQPGDQEESIDALDPEVSPEEAMEEQVEYDADVSEEEAKPEATEEEDEFVDISDESGEEEDEFVDISDEVDEFAPIPEKGTETVQPPQPSPAPQPEEEDEEDILDILAQKTIGGLIKVAKELDDEGSSDAAEEVHKIIRKYQEGMN